VQNFPTDVLKEWFLTNRRDLPWRKNPTPYQVWISEVMLQQTQVSVVIPYFEKWMNTFPSIQSLAEAPLEQVLKCWEGLGYYSRARNLHKGAQVIVENFGGELPNHPLSLSQVPGIGPYTKGALLSFAFRQKAAAVDGNVLRVLSRFLGCVEEIDLPHVKKKLQNYAEEMLPNTEPWLVVEGLIELGALVCGKIAKCDGCPLKKKCDAYRHQLQDLIPKRRARLETIELIRQVAVIHYQGLYAVQKGRQGKLMADLYEFPYLECHHFKNVEDFEKAWGMPLKYQKSLQTQSHTFTRYRARLFPHLLEACGYSENYQWKTIAEMKQLPFSSGHKRILTQLTL